jgi:hypothetical protein
VTPQGRPFLRHLLNGLLGAEDSLRRRAFGRLRWTLGTPLRDWFDLEKRALFGAVRPFTMAGYRRLSSLYDLCRRAEAENRPGAFVECGAWKGGAAGVMASVARSAGRGRRTWVFDSFEGLPDPGAADGPAAKPWAGRCAARMEDAERLLFGTLRLKRAQVILRKGWFQDTLPAARPEIGPIAVLRLDGDWYESTRVSLENLYDGVVPGGFVVLDDYGFWEGFRRAVDEFLAGRRLAPPIIPVDRSAAWFQKP